MREDHIPDCRFLPAYPPAWTTGVLTYGGPKVLMELGKCIRLAGTN